MNHEKPKSTRKTAILRALTLVVSNTVLTGCSQSLDTSVCEDGTCEGQLQPAPDGRHVLIKFTVKGQKMTIAKFTVIDEHGRFHDGEYGKAITGHIDGEFYQRTQCTAGTEPQYAQKLVEISDADKVEVIAEASTSHGLFQSAVKDTLGKCGQAGFASVRFWQVEFSSAFARYGG